jgi:L-threonylcarbamoyladenylate synthase
MKQWELPEKVQQQIEKGIEIIRQGGIVAFPTDTVYGLGAGAYNEPAIKRIFEVKQRPQEMALPLLLADSSQIHEVSLDLPDFAWRLIKEFLPGGLTLVVYRTGIIKDIITGGGNTVAIRIPDHPVPRALISGSGMPIVGTSANISGQSAVLNAEEVRLQLGNKVDLIIDAVPAPAGTESTVVDVTGEKPVVLREGMISRVEIERVSAEKDHNCRSCESLFKKQSPEK